MKLNEDFKISAAKGWSYFKTLCIILLFSALMYEYLTIASNDQMRVIDIKTPFFNTQFLQDLSKPKI